jgi:hypothetical protein
MMLYWPSFRGASKTRTSDVQLHIGESRDSAFDGSGCLRQNPPGASLVQLLTALIYRGPGVVRTITRGLAQLLARDGVKHVADVVGVDAI